MTQEFRDILQEINPIMLSVKEDIHLLRDGIIDSLDIVKIVAALEEELNIKFSIDDVSAKNFSSVQSIWNTVQNIREG